MRNRKGELQRFETVFQFGKGGFRGRSHSGLGALGKAGQRNAQSGNQSFVDEIVDLSNARKFGSEGINVVYERLSEEFFPDETVRRLHAIGSKVDDVHRIHPLDFSAESRFIGNVSAVFNDFFRFRPDSSRVRELGNEGRIVSVAYRGNHAGKFLPVHSVAHADPVDRPNVRFETVPIADVGNFFYSPFDRKRFEGRMVLTYADRIRRKEVPRHADAHQSCENGSGKLPDVMGLLTGRKGFYPIAFLGERFLEEFVKFFGLGRVLLAKFESPGCRLGQGRPDLRIGG